MHSRENESIHGIRQMWTNGAMTTASCQNETDEKWPNKYHLGYKVNVTASPLHLHPAYLHPNRYSTFILF